MKHHLLRASPQRSQIGAPPGVSVNTWELHFRPGSNPWAENETRASLAGSDEELDRGPFLTFNLNFRERGNSD